MLDNAPQNASYTSPQIQKEILQIFTKKIMDAIKKEIGDAKFRIIVDEARDESKKTQMTIILRFVDKTRLVREQFFIFNLVHISNTTSLTLKKQIFNVFCQHNLNMQDICGRGYNGVSNNHREWSRL